MDTAKLFINGRKKGVKSTFDSCLYLIKVKRRHDPQVTLVLLFHLVHFPAAEYNLFQSSSFLLCLNKQ